MPLKKFSKRIVGLILALNVIFTGIVLYIFWTTGYEPSALVVAWFGFTTGELWALSKIKRAEVEKRTQEAGEEWKK